MKKIILTLVFMSLFMTGRDVFAMGEAVDGFFHGKTESLREGSVVDLFGTMPILPASHGLGDDQPAVPVGSGLFLLGTMGVGYLAIRKRD